MLTFFRRIRKKLLEGGSTSKYLFYAIGEIALVVIGILIALQINNWNEWRKDREKEKKVLLEIVQTLEENIELFEDAIENMNVTNISSGIVMSMWENKTSYSDTLEWHLFRSLWTSRSLFTGIPKAGYEALKNTGYDVILNDKLRKEIISIFEKTIAKAQSRFVSNNSNTNYQDHIRKNFLFSESGFVPMDYDKILKDKYYYSIIQYLERMRETHIRWSKEDIQEMKRVLQLITDEVGEDL